MSRFDVSRRPSIAPNSLIPNRATAPKPRAEPALPPDTKKRLPDRLRGWRGARTGNAATLGIVPSDLSLLHNASTVDVIVELTRIDLAIADEAEGRDGHERERLDLGRQMIGEMIRRMRFLQTASGALVLGD